MKHQMVTSVVLLLASASSTANALPKIFYPQDPQAFDATLAETGKRRMCLNFSEIDAVVPIKSNKAVFSDKDGNRYINNFISGCRGLLDPEGTLQFQVSSGKFCRNGRLFVFARAASTPSGSCAVGDFKLLIEMSAPSESLENSVPSEISSED